VGILLNYNLQINRLIWLINTDTIILDPVKRHPLYFVLLGRGHRKEGRFQPKQRPQALEVSHRRPQVDRGQEVLWQVLYRKHQPLWNQVRFC
jgi:hypothetical protein